MSFLAVSARCVRLVAIGRALRIQPLPCQRSLATRYTECRSQYVSLERGMEERRGQARRSLLVQVGSEASCGELVAYCGQYGHVEGVHHYTLESVSQHFMLVEFREESEVENILNFGSCHRRDLECNPMRTPFLWFRADGKKHKPQTEFKLNTVNGCKEVNEDELLDELQNCQDVSEQIQRLYERLSLNDLGVRLRYMVARQVEMAFHNLHANVAVRPFGSSVNGFGKMGCDLDLVLTNSLEEDSKTSQKRLIFHTKKWSGSPSEKWRRHLELAGDILRLCVPGCGRVRHILQARIPIIKYTHELAGLECDLCAANMSGVYMSELLHIYGCLDSRVRPLVFAVRKWAATSGLTNPSPGPWITNFPLTLMVLYFLMQDTKDGAILPSLKYLVDRAGKEDIRVTEDNIDCTFLRDLSKIPPKEFTQNECNVGDLLLKFFEFYSTFDFEEQAISIITGRPMRKPAHTALYIVNPLEKSLNVTRNLNLKECERLRLEVRNAAWKLESNLERHRKGGWGLLELIEKKGVRAVKDLVRIGNSHRLVSVSDLFKEESNEIHDEVREANNRQVEQVKTIAETNKTHVESQVKTIANTEIKNTQIGNQVRKIKQKTRSIIETDRQKIRDSNDNVKQKRVRKR